MLCYIRSCSWSKGISSLFFHAEAAKSAKFFSMTSTLATTPAPAWNTKGNKSLRSLREKTNHREKGIYFCVQFTAHHNEQNQIREGVVTTEQLAANEQGTEVLKNQKKKNKRGWFCSFKRVCILPLCTKFNIFVTRTICDHQKHFYSNNLNT